MSVMRLDCLRRLCRADSSFLQATTFLVRNSTSVPYRATGMKLEEINVTARATNVSSLECTLYI